MCIKRYASKIGITSGKLGIVVFLAVRAGHKSTNAFQAVYGSDTSQKLHNKVVIEMDPSLDGKAGGPYTVNQHYFQYTALAFQGSKKGDFFLPDMFGPTLNFGEAT
jgi:hypothetical protein